ncbi:glutamyl-tRNA amidotransferase [Metamycoplasma neophronis]|uniref:Glutamyl-tRNA amidotransferase n=1 Tax=Metamycoplasma neophronis TaxID=872983 RepID=A0ABY2Z183_9BACT|nr:glutamyl-tRNA amidotransferase [Metamycoplasma neophronis]TPR54312.1 glutamyl-tRNA amidotransferase [Metamycoplasma neophronis]
MDDLEFKKLAQKLLFNPNPEVIDLARNLLNSVDKELRELDEFDLDNYKAQSHINEKPLSFEDLRKDEVDESFYLTQKQVLSNAKEHNDEFVIMRKVINDK